MLNFKKWLKNNFNPKNKYGNNKYTTFNLDIFNFSKKSIFPKLLINLFFENQKVHLLNNFIPKSKYGEKIKEKIKFNIFIIIFFLFLILP